MTMKFPQETLNYFQGKIKSFSTADLRQSLYNKASSVQSRVKAISLRQSGGNLRRWLTEVLVDTKRRGFKGSLKGLQKKTVESWYEINSIGAIEGMEELEIRKLRIFNQLNFLGIITGVTVPISGIFTDSRLPAMTWLVACAPAMISVLVLWLNYLRKYEQAIIVYFIFYPVVTSLVYLGGLNLGIELFFILYGILSVFFIQSISHMLFSIGLSMVSYFMLDVVLKHYQYQLELKNYLFYLFNQVIAIAFIFYGLYLIKEENTGYQWSILRKNRELHRNNLEIQKQKMEIADKAELLEEKTQQLTELNSLKNKLFSVISHDLKTPMYALRNLFQNVQEYNLPAEEIKNLLPDVVNELNYTTGLMENLLQWAKSQMQSNAVRPQKLEVVNLINEVTQLLKIQAEAKNIRLESQVDQQFQVYADRDMVNLVLRNLVANAIKFTPAKGKIIIRAQEKRSFIEISVTDNGVGISDENIDKLFNEYYTSKGTANESGTGLGLMLCKEFLAKNGGQMKVQSQEGKGSTFSFTLPRSEYTFQQQQQSVA
jgi:two-component system sensor histidine kinase/response regulator